MNHLNFFAPYENLGSNHEDHLTRAWLVVFRYVPLAKIAFFQRVWEYQIRKKVPTEELVPPFVTSEFNVGQIATQVQQVPKSGVERLVSVLLTNAPHSNDGGVTRSDRRARYDGVIQYGNIALTIENKPDVQNVRDDQLNPALPPDSEIVIASNAVVLCWKDLVYDLATLHERGCLCGAESILVDDFVQFVMDRFPSLAPFHHLHVCRRRREPVLQRLHMLLNEMAAGAVGYHTGRGYYLALSEPGAARSLWLEPVMSPDGKEVIAIRADLFPGDTMGQARALYSKLNVDRFLKFINDGSDRWEWMPNLHFAFMATNLVWSHKGTISGEDYLRYWMEHPPESISRSDFPSRFKDFRDAGLIGDNELAELDQHFTKTKRQRAFVCPGLRVSYIWPIAVAEHLDRAHDNGHRLANEIVDRMTEAMANWGQIFVPEPVD